jgi:hypothetical protein
MCVNSVLAVIMAISMAPQSDSKARLGLFSAVLRLVNAL